MQFRLATLAMVLIATGTQQAAAQAATCHSTTYGVFASVENQQAKPIACNITCRAGPANAAYVASCVNVIIQPGSNGFCTGSHTGLAALIDAEAVCWSQ